MQETVFCYGIRSIGLDDTEMGCCGTSYHEDELSERVVVGTSCLVKWIDWDVLSRNP